MNYTDDVFKNFFLLYAEALISLGFLFCVKSARLRVVRLVTTILLVPVICVVFVLNSIAAPYVHDYTRYNYTESFTKMLNAMEREYCLNSWKQIDYEELLNKYLPMVDEPECEAEKLGIHNGTTIVAWDNKEINEAISCVECIMPPLRFPVKENEDVFRPIFLAGKGGDIIDITFIDDDGNEKTVSVHKMDSYEKRQNFACRALLNKDMELRNFYTCMLDDKCGYLQMTKEVYDTVLDNVSVVRHGYYPKLTERYINCIEQLKNQGMEYLTNNIAVKYPVFLSLTEDGEPLIDTDYTRTNNIPLDVKIPLTRESALATFSLDGEISKTDYELTYAIEYLGSVYNE